MAAGVWMERFGKPNQVPVIVTERPEPSTQFRWIVAEAVLAPLAAGDYSIETTVGNAKQVTPFQLRPYAGRAAPTRHTPPPPGARLGGSLDPPNGRRRKRSRSTA